MFPERAAQADCSPASRANLRYVSLLSVILCSLPLHHRHCAANRTRTRGTPVSQLTVMSLRALPALKRLPPFSQAIRNQNLAHRVSTGSNFAGCFGTFCSLHCVVKIISASPTANGSTLYQTAWTRPVPWGRPSYGATSRAMREFCLPRSRST
ncbi:hypothetical protein C8R47DRAFT_741724 [Mycena vitilis]|nr:hypothetical protein C8R47DRAFT_741724 [Mycena vitilis]